MSRITKNPEVRKAEIIDIAQKLFDQNGFQKTSVDQIVKTAEVAKGTFYYYFKSKEDVLDCIMEKVSDDMINHLKPIIDKNNLTAFEKLKELLISMRQFYSTNNNVINDIHTIEDAQVHQQSLVRSIVTIAPLMAEIIREGVDNGEFKTDYPEALSEVLLTSAHYLLNSELFITNRQGYTERVKVIQELAEKGLSLPKGSFQYFESYIPSKHNHK